MPNLFRSEVKLCVLIFGIVLTVLSCKESTEVDRVNKYLASINAQESESYGTSVKLPKVGNGNGNGNGNGYGYEYDKVDSLGVTLGTPHTVGDGFCGDGIINGPTEDCDLNAIQNTDCRDYNGLSGTVGCQDNCLYDVSDCMTQKTNYAVGGIAETCDCQCTPGDCQGGCFPIGIGIQGAASECTFDCRDDCICQCLGGKMSAQIKGCDVRCACIQDLNGVPQCRCSLEHCDLITTISPNIGYLVGGPPLAR